MTNLRLLSAAPVLALLLCATATAQQVADLPDPLIVQLNERAARGGKNLAESIAAFARIGEWRLVDRWLAPLATSNDEAELSMMAQTIGSDILFRIATHPQVSPQSVTAARKMGAAARKQLESKDRLVAAISGLGGNADQQLGAIRVLLKGGNTAINVLVDDVVAAQPKAPRDEILRTMASLGKGGRSALEQLALYAEPATRGRALQALSRLDPKGSIDSLLTALYATDSAPEEVEYAKTRLTRLVGAVPSRREATSFLSGNLQSIRQAARMSPNSTQQQTVWSVNQNRNGVAFQPALNILLAYREATDAGARLRRIGGLSPSTLNAVLAADLGYRVMIDPDWGDPDQVKAIRTVYGSAAQGRGISSTIETALEKEDFAAAIGLMRMIDNSASVLDHNVLLLGKSPRLTPLVLAASHSNPRVRYEAASAIARLNPTVAYPGSINVRRALAEMSRLSGREIAVLVETRPEVIVQQERILTELGFETTVLGSVSALERKVALGGEIGLIVSKTHLADLPPIELIDRVRRMPRGRGIPIVFFGEPAEGIDSDRWSAVTRLIDAPPSPEIYQDIVLGIDKLQRVPLEDEVNPPLAILVETREEVIVRQEYILEELGYTPTVVKSLESLKEDLDKGGNVQLVIAPVQLREFRPEVLVKLVRQHPNGKGMLIAFYRESLMGDDDQLWDPYARRVHYPNTAAAYSNILLDIARMKRLPPLTPLDRKIYQNVGKEFFSKQGTGG